MESRSSQTTASVGTQTHGNDSSSGCTSQCCSSPYACDAHATSASGGAQHTPHPTHATTAGSSHRSPLLPREPTALRITDKEMLTSTSSPSTEREEVKDASKDNVKDTVVPLEPRRPTSSPVRHTPLENSFVGNAERRARLKSDNVSGGGTGGGGTGGGGGSAAVKMNRSIENVEPTRNSPSTNIRKVSLFIYPFIDLSK